MEHTPKPWRIRHVTRQDGSGGSKRFQTIGKVGGMDFEIASGNAMTDVQEANATLLWSAPDLLAAGENIVARWEYGDLAGAVRELDQAVKKAKGE